MLEVEDRINKNDKHSEVALMYSTYYTTEDIIFIVQWRNTSKKGFVINFIIYLPSIID